MLAYLQMKSDLNLDTSLKLDIDWSYFEKPLGLIKFILDAIQKTC